MTEFHLADHPENVEVSSDFHTIHITPVFDVIWLGIVDPEYVPRKLLCKQSNAVQSLTVTTSKLNSVVKSLKVSVIEVAAVGAMIHDMLSEFA
jgi:hypothetical protein